MIIFVGNNKMLKEKERDLMDYKKKKRLHLEMKNIIEHSMNL